MLKGNPIAKRIERWVIGKCFCAFAKVSSDREPDKAGADTRWCIRELRVSLNYRTTGQLKKQR